MLLSLEVNQQIRFPYREYRFVQYVVLAKQPIFVEKNVYL